MLNTSAIQKIFANVEVYALPNEVRLTIPTTVNVSENAPAEAVNFIERSIVSLFSRWFGGASVTVQTGHWLSNGADLVSEENRVIRSLATDSALTEHGAELLQLAAMIKVFMMQEAVLLEINGTGYLI